MTTLNELYQQVLATVRMHATPDGFISIRRNPETNNPVILRTPGKPDRRLVLPVTEQLQNTADPKWESRIAFHPLYENISRGESEVMAEYRKNANYHLNGVAGLLAYQLLRLATSPDEQKKLSPDQSEFLPFVKDADEETLEKFKQLLAKIDGDKCMVNIFLRRGGVLNGKKHARLGVVHFPLYEELAKATDKIHGITLRKKKRDRETLMALIKWIFPQVDTPHAYDYGSDSMVAPTMDALMHAMYNVIGPLNDVTATFENILEQPETLRIEAEWITTFDNLANMRAEIYSVPQLTGNEGAVAKSDSPASHRVEAETVAANHLGLPPPVRAPGTPEPVAVVPAAAPVVPSGFALPGSAPIPTSFTPVAPPTHYPASSTRPMDYDEMVRNNPLLQRTPNAWGAAAGGQPPQQMSRGGYAVQPVNNNWGNNPGGNWGNNAGNNNNWGNAAVGSRF